MLVIRSKVNSMDFWITSRVTYNNVQFDRLTPWETFRHNRELIDREHQHHQTGNLTISAPPEITTVDAAREYWHDIVNRLHIILAFAHGHDVPIHEMKVYSVDSLKATVIADEWEAMWLGKSGTSSSNVHSHGLQAFLETAMPLISDKKFNKQTKTMLAITYYNSAINNSFLETKFILLWMGLESMANAFYENNSTDLGVSRQEWKHIKDFCKDYLSLVGKANLYTNLVQDIAFLRQGKTKDRIDKMFNDKKYNLGEYYEFINGVYDDIRNPLFHGETIEWIDKTATVFNLERLMEKIILKSLNFYDNDFVAHAIKQANLSAR
jgi:hypothetical protein